MQRPIPPDEWSTDELVERIVVARIQKARLVPEDPGWHELDSRERYLTLALHRRFGIENITPAALDWLLTRERSRAT